MDHGVTDNDLKRGMRGNQVVEHGFKTQVKSKDALIRIKKRVGNINDLADDAATNLEK
jgi:hypothetical protein